MADILQENKRNLNNWTKNFDFFFENNYADNNNSVSYRGGANFERIYIPLNVKKNRNYIFRFSFCSSSGFTLGGYGSDEEFAFVTATEPSQGTTGALQYDILGRTEALDTNASDTPVVYEAVFNSGQNTTVYVAIDFGYITDGTNYSFEIDDIQLDNTVQPPKEYLHYIESDGAQYINLDYTPTVNTKIELTCRILKNNDRAFEALFGSRYRSYRNNAFVFFSRHNGLDQPSYNRSGVETVGEGLIYDKDIVLTCYRENAEWHDLYGNSGTLTSGGSLTDGVAPLFLFDLNNAQSTGDLHPDNSRSKMRVLDLKIFEGSTLVRHYLPALDNDDNAYLYETEEMYDYRNAGTGIFSFGQQLFYLIQAAGVLYTIESGQLVQLEETEITAQIFIDHGSNDIPLWDAISSLTDPKILVWRNSETAVGGEAIQTAIPVPQTVYSPTYYMTDPTILGIESATIEASDDAVFAVSFDRGDSWKMYTGEAWATLTEDDTGMSADTMMSIPTEAWNSVAVTGSFRLRVTLPDRESYVGAVRINYLN